MNIIEFHEQANAQASRKWIMGYRTLVLTKNVVKVRLSIRENLYIDLYFNQRYGTTNYALILDEERYTGEIVMTEIGIFTLMKIQVSMIHPKKGRRYSV